MKSYRKELWFEVGTRRALINITPEVNACLAERLPIRRGKVDCLVKIEAMIESCMIRLWERNHKLSSTLVKCIDIDSRLE